MKTLFVYIFVFLPIPFLAGQNYELQLGGLSFDPLLEVNPPAPKEGEQLRLIQLLGPSKDQDLEMLTSDGITLVQYFFPYTYIAWANDQNLQKAGKQEFVRWTGDFKPEYKLLPRYRNMKGRQSVRVLFYSQGSIRNFMDNLAASGEILKQQESLTPHLAIITLSVDSSEIDDLAAIPEIYSVQPIPTDGGPRSEVTSQINLENVNAQGIAFPGYLNWINQTGLDGSGVIIANVDNGIDQTHVDLASHILPCSGPTCGGNTSNSHGTHTAGIMVGDGTSGVIDGFGFLRGLGVAPGANLIEQVNFSYTDPNGMLNLMTESYLNGASLSGNSWGPSGSPRGYDADTLQVDIGVRDCVPLEDGNQSLTYVLSIMNGYGGVSKQGTPDEGKNIFTIGSTVARTSSGAQTGQINNLSSNSAHGPCLDGRIIPHMVAPGCLVDSTILGSSPNNYGFKCGTSMASPQVSGSIALFIQYYRQYFNGTRPDPSPALVKAAFLPVAHQLIGDLDANGQPMGAPFNSKCGWGRLALSDVVTPQVEVVYFDQDHLFDDSGEVWVRNFLIPEPDQPVKIMLVWTDAPGHGLGGNTPAWNNNLDLEVVIENRTYKGNGFGANGFSITDTAFDEKNNTEGVIFQPQLGEVSFQVRVHATNINSDGVPWVGDNTDQDFALVLYNAGISPVNCDDVTIQFDFPPDAWVCPGQPFSLEVQNITGGQDPYSFQWAPSDYLENPNSRITTGTILEETPFQITVTDINGCQETQTLWVHILPIDLVPLLETWRTQSAVPNLPDVNHNQIADILDFVRAQDPCDSP